MERLSGGVDTADALHNSITPPLNHFARATKNSSEAQEIPMSQAPAHPQSQTTQQTPPQPAGEPASSGRPQTQGGPAQAGGPQVQRQFVNFAFFKIDPAIRRLNDHEKIQARSEFLKLFE